MIALGRTLKIAVTGGIGSGKTTVSRYIENNYSSLVFYADTESKYLLDTSELVKSQIQLAFGSDLLKNNIIDKRTLAERAFKTKQKQEKLNRIMWPEVQTMIDSRYLDATIKKKKLFIVDAAMIIESGIQNNFDHIILIKADIRTRIDRVTENRGLSKTEIENRASMQVDDIEREQFTNNIIDNESDLESLYKKINKLLSTF